MGRRGGWEKIIKQTIDQGLKEQFPDGNYSYIVVKKSAQSTQIISYNNDPERISNPITVRNTFQAIETTKPEVNKINIEKQQPEEELIILDESRIEASELAFLD